MTENKYHFEKWQIDNIQKAIDIADILNYYGTSFLPRGKFTCISPKHTDKTPSMSIWPEANVCHCFACNVTLTPIQIVQIEEKVSFKDAAEILVDRYNLDTEEYRTPFNIIEQKKKASDFPLSMEDLNALGLTGNYNQKYYKETSFKTRDKDGNETITTVKTTGPKFQNIDNPEATKEDEQYVYNSAKEASKEFGGTRGIVKFWEEDREACVSFLSDRIDFYLSKLDELLEDIDNSQEIDLKPIIMEKVETLENIQQKLDNYIEEREEELNNDY